ncbi:MAG: glycosyltransferase family 2 protein [Desulfobacteraceae bacterium]|jgi:glycosyltransferase involved in cell wall biosynthesis
MNSKIFVNGTKSDIVTVVIPVYNGEHKLSDCLEAVFKSDYPNFEVIVVDDNSSDKTAYVAQQYPCKVVRLSSNSGPAVARNKGVEHAKGDYILFIDDDVIIQRQTISRIVLNFQKDESISAQVGNLIKENGFSNFFSQFKNLHHRYHLCSFPDYIKITFTTITAVKKCDFIKIKGFNSIINTASVEDIEFGQRLTDNGFKILHDKNLYVVHQKHYSLKSYFKNTLNRSYCHFKLFLINRGFFRLKNDNKVVYFPKSTVVSFLLGPVILLLFPVLFILDIFKGFAVFTLLLLLFAFLNKGFLIYLLKNKGFSFAISACFVVLVDSWILSIGSSFALMDIYLGKKRKWKLI